jgi:osmotically-inducible protein OsmY
MEAQMHERSTWWRPEDHNGRGAARGGSRDRPYWWRDDDLPFDHDDERAARAYEEEREARYRDYEDDRRRRDARYRDEDLDRPRERHHRGWGERAADEVKAMLGSDRAERRREMDREIEAREEHRDERRSDERRDYRGVGPRMRHDEDDDLLEEICNRLADDPDLDASDILVRVIDNEAILDGTVRSKRDAERAHHLASDVRGVIYVRDRLRIGRSSDDRVRRATIGMGYDDSPSRRERRRERRWS